VADSEVLEIRVRRATAEDAPALAAVELTGWRAAYRGLMPDAFLDGLSEAAKAADWHRVCDNVKARSLALM
jgi:hypothetical protein